MGGFFDNNLSHPKRAEGLTRPRGKHKRVVMGTGDGWGWLKFSVQKDALAKKTCVCQACSSPTTCLQSLAIANQARILLPQGLWTHWLTIYLPVPSQHPDLSPWRRPSVRPFAMTTRPLHPSPRWGGAPGHVCLTRCRNGT